MTKELFPILILSDAPSASTGLGRIARDLAIRVHAHLGDVARVATFGHGGPGSSKLPFPQYTIEGMADWVVPTLPEVWQDFAGSEKGAIFTIWDASRLTWFSQPARSEHLINYPYLREWLIKTKFQRWGYFPIDAEGPEGKLSFPMKETMRGFDRILAYGKWAEGLIRTTLRGTPQAGDIDALPHGIDTDTFFETDHQLCRQFFFKITGAGSMAGQVAPLADDEALIGIVATNQKRKDWALGIQTAALIAKQRKMRLWIHTDILERDCSIPTLLVDYGLVDKTVISIGVVSDEKMAEAYSACDLTLGIGAGEGFGYPLAESLACGTPVLHGNYAGGAEIVPPEMRIEPIAFHMEGLYNCVRPVFNPQDWANLATILIGNRSALSPEYDWKELWPRWENWFRKGLA